MYVRDSRGRKSNTVTTTITVQDYSNPSISGTEVYRCLQSGSPDENGTYASIMCNVTYSEIKKV